MKKRGIGIILFLMLALMMTGCTNHDEIFKEQAIAIEQAINESAKQTEEFFQFEYNEDIERQIRLATQDKAKNDKLVEYELKVDLLDVTAMDMEVMATFPEELDEDTFNQENFLEEYVNHIEFALEQYTIDDEILPRKEFTLVFQLEKNGKLWAGKIKDESLKEMVDIYRKDFDQCMETYLDQDGVYLALTAVKQGEEKLKETFEGTLYENLVYIDDFELLDDESIAEFPFSFVVALPNLQTITLEELGAGFTDTEGKTLAEVQKYFEEEIMGKMEEYLKTVEEMETKSEIVGTVLQKVDHQWKLTSEEDAFIYLKNILDADLEKQKESLAGMLPAYIDQVLQEKAFEIISLKLNNDILSRSMLLTSAAQQEEIEELNKGEEVTFLINVEMADVSKAENTPILEELAQIPYVEGDDISTYMEKCQKTVEKGIYNQLSPTGENRQTIDLQAILYQNENKELVLAIDDKQIGDIQKQTTIALEEKIQAILSESETYQNIVATEKAKSKVFESISNEVYAQEFVFVDAVKQGEDIIISAIFPSIEKVFSRASQSLYDEYALGKNYDKVELGEIEQALSQKINQEIKSKEGHVNEKITLYANGEFNEEWQNQLILINNGKEKIIEETLQRINDELVIYPEEFPPTGILSGGGKGQKIKIETSAELGHLYVTFFTYTGNDEEDMKNTVATVFVRAGDSLTLRLPTGDYKMIQSTGENWYGETNAFGERGSYQISDMIITIKKNYEYTLTLYGQADGNLPTRSIPYPFGN